MVCPKCGSDNWKMASILHAEGLSRVSASSFGVGVGNVYGGDIFAGAANVGGGLMVKYKLVYLNWQNLQVLSLIKGVYYK